MLIGNAAFEPNNQKSIVKPDRLTHGTMECHNLKETRKFLEECLGMEVVRHAPPGMVMRCGLKFHIVCLETGNEVRPNTIANHWGLDVRTKEEVDEDRKRAVEGHSEAQRGDHGGCRISKK